MRASIAAGRLATFQPDMKDLRKQCRPKQAAVKSGASRSPGGYSDERMTLP